MNSNYSDQKKACKTLFVDNLPKLEYTKMEVTEDTPFNTDHLGGAKYNITGLSGQEVVTILSERVVNDTVNFTANATFYLFIQDNPKLELFQIKANPTPNQPGNGVVSLRPRGQEAFNQGAKSYEDLTDALDKFYGANTKQFVLDIKKLFKNNKEFFKVPEATSEVYMIWLFEIARRLVKRENPTEKQKELDDLPIGSAIAGFLKLLECGDNTICSFDDVFLQTAEQVKFHCFTGEPEERKTAIENIDKVISAKINKEAKNENYYLEELQTLFCPKYKYKGLMSCRRPNLNFSSDSESSSEFE